MSPYERSIIGTGEPIESENKMEFRLIFQGELPPSAGTNRRHAEKHEIRRSFHPQLKRLWSVQRGLQQYASGEYARANNKMNDYTHNKENAQFGRWKEGIEIIGKNWNRGGVDFVPLVTADFALRCAMDVLLLRPNDEKHIFRQGDIDGQLKTVLDALRIPKDKQEMDDLDASAEDQPFYCLLEDDRLVSRVRVIADELLVLPNQREVKANDVFAVIHVELNHTGGSPFNRWFA